MTVNVLVQIYFINKNCLEIVEILFPFIFNVNSQLKVCSCPYCNYNLLIFSHIYLSSDISKDIVDKVQYT